MFKIILEHHCMNKAILIFIFFGVFLFARHEAFPTQECPAFNNIKHTQNIHGGLVDKAKF